MLRRRIRGGISRIASCNIGIKTGMTRMSLTMLSAVSSSHEIVVRIFAMLVLPLP